MKAVWMARAESMGGWGAVIVINQRSVIKDGMYEAEKELTYLRDFNSGGDEPRRPDRAVHAFVIVGVCKAESMGDLPTLSRD